MKRKHFRVTLRDGTYRTYIGRSMHHVIGLIPDHDLIMSVEEIDENGIPIGGIYSDALFATFSTN
jgi:hypothetical protein